MQLTELAAGTHAAPPVFLAVSVDSRDDSLQLIGELEGDPKSFPVRLLEDRGHGVIDRYGLRNPSSRAGIPHPGTFVIDRKGVVRWRFVETDYAKRPSNEEILDALAGLENGA